MKRTYRLYKWLLKRHRTPLVPTARDIAGGKNEMPLTLHKYLYCTNEPLNNVDLNGLWTMHVTFGGMASYGASGVIQRGFAWDDDGNFGAIKVDGVGVGSPDVGAGFQFGWTSADTIYDLAGVGGAFGGSGRTPWGPSGGVEFIYGRNKKYWGLELTLSISAAMSEYHTHCTKTKIMTWNNGTDLSDEIIESATNAKTYGEARAMLMMMGIFE
jgi:hypothetical protein